MKVLFGAGHVLGEKIWMGYNEDLMMFDLAKREAKYANERYGIKTKTFYVTHTSYPAVEEACTGCDLAIFEHSNATASPVNESVNRVVVYRTVQNPGDGPCRVVGLETARILNTFLADIQHRKNKSGNDWYGVLGRAMKAGCKDTWLAENGFHTHPGTRELLLNPEIRQRLAEAKVDAMARYYNWEGNMRRTLKITSPLMQGEDVREFQEAMNKLMDAGLVVDGYYGEQSESVASKFQEANNLSVDGIVGPNTWNMIDDLLAGPDFEALYRGAQETIAERDATIRSLKDQLLSAENAYDLIKLKNDEMYAEAKDTAQAIRDLLAYAERYK